LQPQLRSATVQLTGDAAIARRIEQVIAVQQQQHAATDLDLPGPEVQRPAGQLERDVHPFPRLIA